MFYYIIKILISAILIMVISEVSKRSSLIGGIFASIPLISFIAIIWLYIDTQDVSKIISLSSNIFWLVLPSLSFFVLFPILLKARVSFPLAMVGASVVMVLFYYVIIFFLKKIGIFT